MNLSTLDILPIGSLVHKKNTGEILKPLWLNYRTEYSDALKNSFFPRTIPMWNSLPSSVVSSKTIEEFKAQI